MRSLSASDLLDIWERSTGAPPVEQALLILAAAFPEIPGDALLRLDIAQRDTALFHLRERTFGPQLKGLADCPACGERLEVAFSANDLRAAGILPAQADTLLHAQAPTTFTLNDYQIIFRLPNSADLLGIAALTDSTQARQQLLDACIVEITHQAQALALRELPADVTQAIIEHIGQHESLANLTIASTCPACGHAWEIIFDIVSYFCSEINAWAVRMMREVHILASTYGWREADILAMSAWRRQRYLELIGV